MHGGSENLLIGCVLRTYALAQVRSEKFLRMLATPAFEGPGTGCKPVPPMQNWGAVATLHS